TPLPTLKPRLAASAPRLSTGCSLRFTGSGLSPDYITCTELAHPSCPHCSSEIPRSQELVSKPIENHKTFAMFSCISRIIVLIFFDSKIIMK
ncbi:MAG TPA: hypothetical protein H9668_10285, partial [Firmicutes bacterium]|nr:hypothetical protein [Bacillota bacterium]